MSPFVQSLRRKYKAEPPKITKEKLDQYLADGFISLEEYDFIVS